ncbi:hypothetical protein DICVIV_10577 [Dictyocaulus viviparus]|uniref:G-protein coupled receptors family 1 profile domain-containing protein n=1 Tax=Dictyocaulus viviparus TaxID=29172 RepID=A0A0D8XFH7_DICVI|nr:hypothetical protein DICVIV_10577 [Dictyocaulus viviparus]
MGDSIPLYHGPIFLESNAYTAMLFFTLLLTINRFTIFIFPRINNILFSVKNTLKISCLIWIYTLITMIIHRITGCVQFFDKSELYFYYNCTEQIRNGYEMDNFLFYQNHLMAIIMCLLYVIIYVKIRMVHQNVTRAFKTETIFLIQTIPLTVLLGIGMLSFKLVPLLNITGRYRFFVAAFENLIIIVNEIASPVLLLIFNRDIQKFSTNIVPNPLHTIKHNEVRGKNPDERILSNYHLR